jgi:hypothetical protein
MRRVSLLSVHPNPASGRPAHIARRLAHHPEVRPRRAFDRPARIGTRLRRFPRLPRLWRAAYPYIADPAKKAAAASNVNFASTISSASPSPTTREPIDSMLASLCWRIMRAENVSAQTPQRMPFTLFAAIMMPWPVPHRMTPNRQSPEATSRAAAWPCLG